jgi:hypothetical protein
MLLEGRKKQQRPKYNQGQKRTKEKNSKTNSSSERAKPRTSDVPTHRSG